MEKESIKQTITECLQLMNIPFDRIDENTKGACTTFIIYSKEARLLIGAGGEHLNAFGYIIRSIIDQKHNTEDRPIFIVDVNNYKTKKLQELTNSAELAARRAKLFRQDVELQPMTPYERMIVHSFFSDDLEVSTESHGEGPYRHVVIKYHRQEPTTSGGV